MVIDKQDTQITIDVQLLTPGQRVLMGGVFFHPEARTGSKAGVSLGHRGDVRRTLGPVLVLGVPLVVNRPTQELGAARERWGVQRSSSKKRTSRMHHETVFD